ncbi:cytochrome c oxidase subunit 3 [Arenibaculum pallidiluteum]|uniref:cytochrome c oxidase subunit 3 n=1 Tax=Arenibaculum pallidiluteum TaxID=2812559 RepID=UPI001A968BC0|nr:cytochrome c oxidase subunit 3 [Arenibaculum pallidiluteum]
MNPLGSLGAKPWLQPAQDVPAWGRLPFAPAQVGLAIFMAVVTALFGLLAAAYLMRMTLGDWRPLPEPPILWLNTLALALGSAALQRSSTLLRRGDPARASTAFVAGGGCAGAFLAGQIAAWAQLDALGYFVATNPANTFFYLLTALHGLHLLGGLAAWARTAWHLRSAPGARATRLGVGLCAAYWHFLLVVWLALLALLMADDAGWMPAMHHGAGTG